jgi:integral membrane protein
LSSITNLRRVALTEATSFLALLVATYFKLGQDSSGGKTAVAILGPIHGLLFLAYVFLTITLKAQEGWSTGTTLLILVGAVIPFGGYYVDWWLRQQAQVA